LKKPFFFLILIYLTASSPGCGNQEPPSHQNSLYRIYQLLDQGKNATAIYLLTKIIKDSPENSEAHALLASAYLGEAGINIYSIHDAFKDILFDRSLGESFWKQASPSAPERSSSASIKVNQEEETDIEKLLDQTDIILIQLRKTITYLNRFPYVIERNWILLDQAIYHLNLIEGSKDLYLYRIFIRMIYLKSYLDKNIIMNNAIGRKQWICNIQLYEVREQIQWIVQHIKLALEDFYRIYPDQSPSVIYTHSSLTAFLDALDEWRESAPLGGNTGLLNLHVRLKEAMKCHHSGKT
jgi:hypothetical protein